MVGFVERSNFLKINEKYLEISNLIGDLSLTMPSVPITTNIVSLYPAHGKVYSIQYCVIKIVSD
jgi:hypothetical protein